MNSFRQLEQQSKDEVARFEQKYQRELKKYKQRVETMSKQSTYNTEIMHILAEAVETTRIAIFKRKLEGMPSPITEQT